MAVIKIMTAINQIDKTIFFISTYKQYRQYISIRI